MNIECGRCGQKIVIADGLEEGQHVRCPYCDEKFEFHVPSRIELTPEQDKQPANRTSLHVIRKEGVAPESQGEASQRMFSRRLHMAEEHARFYEEMKERESRRKTREKIQGFLMFVVFVLCAVGVYWYVGYRKEKRHQAEIAFAEEKNRLETERAENERRQNAMRRAEEKAAHEKKVAEENLRRLENQKELDRQKAEREKAEKELFESKVLYRKTCALFAEGKFDFLQSNSPASMPGVADGVFYYLLPFLDNGEIVICQSATNGIRSVCRLDDTGKRTPMEEGTFLESLTGKDYLMAYEDRVYFQSKRKKPHVAAISKADVVDLVKEFFGDITPEVKRLDLDPEALSFEIVFVPKNSKKVIIADTVEYGVQYSLEKVREAIEDAFPMRRVKSTVGKKSSFKRTVVFWDGAHIKKGIDGVTYVPRVAPPMSYGATTLRGPGWNYDREWHTTSKRVYRAEYTYAHWQSLSNEAKKQEIAEQQYHAERENSAAAREQEKMSRAERAYVEKINKIYSEGTLYFRAKIASQK